MMRITRLLLNYVIQMQTRTSTNKLNRSPNCLFCIWFRFISGEPSYSELTSGSEAEIYCQKEIWELDMHWDLQEDYERKMLMAETCKLYEKRKHELD